MILKFLLITTEINTQSTDIFFFAENGLASVKSQQHEQQANRVSDDDLNKLVS